MEFLVFIDGHLEGVVASGGRKMLPPGAVGSSSNDSEECVVELGGRGTEDKEKTGKSRVRYPSCLGKLSVIILLFT